MIKLHKVVAFIFVLTLFCLFFLASSITRPALDNKRELSFDFRGLIPKLGCFGSYKFDWQQAKPDMLKSFCSFKKVVFVTMHNFQRLLYFGVEVNNNSPTNPKTIKYMLTLGSRCMYVVFGGVLKLRTLNNC